MHCTQGCLLGYCFRQKVVSETRAQYEQLVSEIRQDNACSLAKETIDWPSPVTLCCPVFNGETSATPVVKPLVATLSEDVHLHGRQQETSDKTVGTEIFETLPKDKESLLELRSKLGMELVWIKQAISSRQKVNIVLKKKIFHKKANLFISPYFGLICIDHLLFSLSHRSKFA